MSNRNKVIIVGGGFGGIAAAKVLKNSQFDVTIIDKKNHHLFQPLLYQVATAALSPGDIAAPIRGIFSSSTNIKTVLGEVTGIDKDSRLVHLKNGNNLPYDYLVLAPGAIYNYFGNDDWEKSAPGLKTIDNALKIRERILLSLEKADQIEEKKQREHYLRYVIIGAGPTGVETAGAIAEIAKRNMMRDFKGISPDETDVILIEAGEHVLNGYPEELSEIARKDLENMGVRVITGKPVSSIQPDGVTMDNEFIETPNIIWAAGVKAAPILDALNAKTDKMGRVKITSRLNLPGYDNIFVIGDAAYLEDEKGEPLPALAPAALQMGKYVGKAIKNSRKNIKPFQYTDKGTMATIGRAKAVADIRGFTFSGIFAWFLWSVIHIFFLIGFRNRFRVFAEWIWHYVTFKRGVRLITGRFSDH